MMVYATRERKRNDNNVLYMRYWVHRGQDIRQDRIHRAVRREFAASKRTMTIECVYQRIKNASQMDDPVERLLGAVILRAVMDYFNPNYRQDVEQFFQVGLGSWLDVDWIKTIQMIGDRT